MPMWLHLYVHRPVLVLLRGSIRPSGAFTLFWLTGKEMRDGEWQTIWIRRPRPLPEPCSRPAMPPRTSANGIWAEEEMSVMPRCRSEEHTSELQSRGHLVCRLLLEKKNDDT